MTWQDECEKRLNALELEFKNYKNGGYWARRDVIKTGLGIFGGLVGLSILSSHAKGDTILTDNDISIGARKVADIGQANFNINKLDRILEWASKTTLTFKGTNEIPLKIGTAYFSTTADVTISTATDLDTGTISNGKDYYVYACNSSGTLVFKISLNSTYPSGFSASTSRKIGGFHTLSVAVGTISGHTLTGYVANDILPRSVWDLKHRPRSNPEGMVWSSEIQKWVDIYLASGTGASTASTYNATISDTRDWNDFVDDGAAVGKRLLDDDEFQAIAAGSNEETNITGSADPVTTGGHSDTAARRMISNIGCEDCTGALWQWLRTQSTRWDVVTPGWGWYNLPGAKGSLYNYGGTGGEADVKLLAGSLWDSGADCGSRSRSAANYRWATNTKIGGRFLAEPL